MVAKNKETYFTKRLTEEVGQALLFFNPWQDFQVPEAQKYLIRTTGVYGSDLDLHILATLPAQQLINPLPSLKIFRSKLTQYEWMEERNFKVPEWINLNGVDVLNVEKFFRLFPSGLVKPHIGQGGWGIEGMNWENFKTWWKKKRGVDESFILQKFIPSALELRCFFIKGLPHIVLERRSKSNIAANFKQQGLAKLATLPYGLESIVAKLIFESGLDYGAIDLLIEGDQVYFLDINSVPGIEQLEQVSGQNIIRNLLTANFFSQLF